MIVTKGDPWLEAAEFYHVWQQMMSLLQNAHHAYFVRFAAVGGMAIRGLPSGGSVVERVSRESAACAGPDNPRADEVIRL